MKLMELDETVCKRPGCQHPQCWVTLRRIEQGNPRYRPPPDISRQPSQDEGGLPVLSVSTLPSTRILQNGGDNRVIVACSRGASPAKGYNMYSTSVTCSMEKVFFPGVNSYREIIAPSRGSGSSISSKKPRKVKILDPSFRDTKSKDVTMVWVPNTQHKSPKTEGREKPIKIWIKDLSLTDPPGGTKREMQNPVQIISKKQKKPPTGGCPLNLTLIGSSPLPHTKNIMRMRDVQEHPEEASKYRRRLHNHWPDVDSLTSPSLSGIIVENRRVILHDMREKGRVVPHTSSVYRLDEEQSAALDNMEVNLDSIRNQYYLWKKYIHLAGPSHRIKPPDHKMSKTGRSHKSMAPDQLSHIGLFPYDPDSALSHYKSQVLETSTESVVCDTRSHDSESRNSPSLAEFSQKSWTDEESSQTPSEMDNSREAQQETPGEKNKEEQRIKLTEAEDVASECPVLEQKDITGDEKSTRPKTSPGPLESAMKSTNVHENPEQRPSSPQPNPPPPSPLY
ncbi:uncharacterized protein C9orf43 homolog [Leptodactylus fuscus]|uniref:uncharacterized protein C9orf43 homolog n=1 Tax=Leptodactylus fuscus TaxID=238119 RepID=UPI003F4ECCDB